MGARPVAFQCPSGHEMDSDSLRIMTNRPLFSVRFNAPQGMRWILIQEVGGELSPEAIQVSMPLRA